jgi:hypothetical protein
VLIVATQHMLVAGVLVASLVIPFPLQVVLIGLMNGILCLGNFPGDLVKPPMLCYRQPDYPM